MMTESSSSTSIAGKLVGGADPKALEPTKRDADGLKIVTPHSGPRQHLGMAPMHRGQAVSQFNPFFGPCCTDRSFGGEGWRV